MCVWLACSFDSYIDSKSYHLAPHHPLTHSFASCHSIAKFQKRVANADGELTFELIGDPLDLKMFDTANWMLSEPSVTEEEQIDTTKKAMKKRISDSYSIVAPSGEIGMCVVLTYPVTVYIVTVCIVAMYGTLTHMLCGHV